MSEVDVKSVMEQKEQEEQEQEEQDQLGFGVLIRISGYYRSLISSYFVELGRALQAPNAVFLIYIQNWVIF